MTIREFIGNAPSIAQLDTFTPGGTIVEFNEFTITINGKAVTYIAGSTPTASTVSTGFQALLAANGFPEFKEITWTATGTTFTGTSKVAGRPFTMPSRRKQWKRWLNL